MRNINIFSRDSRNAQAAEAGAAQASSTNGLVKAGAGVRGALTVGAIGLLSVGALAGCSPSNEKDASQGSSESVSEVEPVGDASEGAAVPYTKTDGGLKIAVHNLLKPGADIMVTSHCGDTDTHARLTTSLNDEVIEMNPAADVPELWGNIEAPAQIGPGPADGYHTITVTCDSGMTGTITLNSAGNADMPAQK